LGQRGWQGAAADEESDQGKDGDEDEGKMW